MAALGTIDQRLEARNRAFEARIRALEFTVGYCSIHGGHLESPVSESFDFMED